MCTCPPAAQPLRPQSAAASHGTFSGPCLWGGCPASAHGRTSSTRQRRTGRCHAAPEDPTTVCECVEGRGGVGRGKGGLYVITVEMCMCASRTRVHALGLSMHFNESRPRQRRQDTVVQCAAVSTCSFGPGPKGTRAWHMPAPSSVQHRRAHFCHCQACQHNGAGARQAGAYLCQHACATLCFWAPGQPTSLVTRGWQ